MDLRRAVCGMRSNEVSGYCACHQTRTSLPLASPLFTALGGRCDDNVPAFYFSDFYDPERFYPPFPLSPSRSFPVPTCSFSRSLSSLLFSVSPTSPPSPCLSFSLSPIRSSSRDLCVLRQRCKQTDIFWRKSSRFCSDLPFCAIVG